MASSSRLDPREVLGVDPRADADEITAAYRREAKRWHPDRSGEVEAADRMALVNAAYAELRATAGSPLEAGGEATTDRATADAPPGGPGETPLDDAARRALGRELGAVLEPDEQVELVTATATWASPQAYLAVTDRRLLWLLDDAPVHRVRTLPRTDVARITSRPARFWRGASVTIEDRRGRRHSFGELPTPTAEALVRRISTGPRTTRRDLAG
ncbi:MAG: J domain-containing protein [Patulibacter sp.]